MSKFLKPEVKASLLKTKATKQELEELLRVVRETRGRAEQVSFDIDLAFMGVEERQRSVMVGLGNLATKVTSVNRTLVTIRALLLGIGVGLIALLFRG